MISFLEFIIFILFCLYVFKEALSYGIYEFKKGFNGNVIELIGQFSLKITNFYDIYMTMKKIKNKIKKRK